MKIAQRLEDISEYYFSQKLREIDQLNQQGRNVINLGIGSPDLPPHPDVIAELQRQVSRPDVHAYQSYKGSAILRNAMADWYLKWYGVRLDPNTEILPLIGSKEGIMHICMTYLDKGDKALIPDPGYPTYASAVKIAGGKPVNYSLKQKNHYFPQIDRMKKKDLARVKLMFVNYPHMPTGQLPERSMFEELVSFAAENKILLVHDNPYSFILNDHPMSLLSIDSAMDHVIELNSLSKSHNMAGWRVGMLCGAKQRIDEVLRFKSNMDSGMFLPVQLAAAKALTLGKEWHNEVNSIYKKRRARVFIMLDQLGCKYSMHQAGLFVWAGIPTKYKDGFEMSDDLLQRSAVFITPGGIFGNEGKKYVRVSLCSKEEIIMEAITRTTTLNKI